MKSKSPRMGKALVVLATSAIALTGVFIAPARAATTISLWHLQTVGNMPKLIQDSVDRFQADNPGVTVDVSPIANDAYKDKIKVALGANNAPCIFPSWGGGPLNAYVKAGQVIDLSSYVNANNYKKRFIPASWSNVTFNNKVYGIPVENSSVAVVWYSKPIFKKYGITPPRTFDMLMKDVKKLGSKGVAAFTLAGASKWPAIMWYDYLADRVGGSKEFTTAALRTGGKFNDASFVKAGQLLQQLVKANAFVKGFNGITYDNGQQLAPLYAGKAAMELMGTWEYSQFVTDKKTADFGFFPFPSVKGGKGDASDVLGTVGDNYYSISSTCPDKAAAFKVIQYMIDDKSVTARVAEGRMPPVVGVKYTDPNQIAIANLIGKAKAVQLWWDQYLPPEFAQLHLDQTQALLALSQTPQGMADTQEALAVKLLGPSTK